MTKLFFWLGTTGGFGILLLLAADRGGGDRVLRPRPPRRERLAAADRPRRWPPILLAGSSCWPSCTTPPCSASRRAAAAAWALPASYAAVAASGWRGGWYCKTAARDIYAAIGLGAHAITGQLTPASDGTR